MSPLRTGTGQQLVPPAEKTFVEPPPLLRVFQDAGSGVRPDVYASSSQVVLRAPHPDARWFMVPESAGNDGIGGVLAGPLDITYRAVRVRDTASELRFTRRPASTGLYWALFDDDTQTHQHIWRVTIDLSYEDGAHRIPAPGYTHYPVMRVDEPYDDNQPTGLGPGLYVQPNHHVHVVARPDDEILAIVDAAPRPSLVVTERDWRPFRRTDTALVWVRGRTFDLRRAVASTASGKTAWTPDPNGGAHSLWAVQDLGETGVYHVPLVRRALVRVVLAQPHYPAPASVDERTIVLDGSSTGTLALPATDRSTGLPLAWTHTALPEAQHRPTPVLANKVGLRRAADDDDMGVYRASAPALDALPIRDPELVAALLFLTANAPLEAGAHTKLQNAIRTQQQALQTALHKVERMLAPLWADPTQAFAYTPKNANTRAVMGRRYQLLHQQLRLGQLAAVLAAYPHILHTGNAKKLTAFVASLLPAALTSYTLNEKPQNQDGAPQARMEATRTLLAGYAPYYAPMARRTRVPALLSVDLGPVLARVLPQALADPTTDWPGVTARISEVAWQFLVPRSNQWWLGVPGLAQKTVPVHTYLRTVRPAGYDKRAHATYDPIYPPAWGSVVWPHTVRPADWLPVQWWAGVQAQSSRPYPLWLRLWDGEQWAAERVHHGDRRVPVRTPEVFAEARRSLIQWWATELDAQPGLAGRLPPAPAHSPAALDAVYGNDDGALDARRELDLAPHPRWHARPGTSAMEARAWRFLLAAPSRTGLQRAGARFAPAPTWPELEPYRSAESAPGAEIRGVWLDGPSSTEAGPRQYDPLEQVLDELAALRLESSSKARREMVAQWLSGSRPLRRNAVFVRLDGTSWAIGAAGGVMVQDARGMPAVLSRPASAAPFARGGGHPAADLAGVLVGGSK